MIDIVVIIKICLINMRGEIELIKIGQVLDDYNTSTKKTIMLIADGDNLINYYIKIFIDKVGDDYHILMANADTFIRSYRRVSSVIKGVPDNEPIVGKRFTINNLMWGTSTVKVIVDDSIFITKNSVYAIHDVSKIREKKLKELGI